MLAKIWLNSSNITSGCNRLKITMRGSRQMARSDRPVSTTIWVPVPAPCQVPVPGCRGAPAGRAETAVVMRNSNAQFGFGRQAAVAGEWARVR